MVLPWRSVATSEERSHHRAGIEMGLVRIPASWNEREGVWRRLPGAVLTCESAEVVSPNEYPLGLPMNEDVAWFTSNEVELTGSASSQFPGRVVGITKGGGGGMVDVNLRDS